VPEIQSHKKYLKKCGLKPITINIWNMPENPWPKITYGNAQLEISCDAFFRNNIPKIDLLKTLF